MFATVLHRIPYLNEEGIEGERLIMRPGKKLKLRYKLQDKDLDRDETITRWYAKPHLIQIDSDEILVMCGFNGETPTPVTAYFGDLLREVMELRKDALFYKLRCTALEEERYYLSLDFDEKMRRITDTVSYAMKVRGRMDDPVGRRTVGVQTTEVHPEE